MNTIKVRSGITKNKESGFYEVSYSRRHPTSRKVSSLKRTRTDKGEPICSLAEAQRIHTQLIIKLEKKVQKEAFANKPSWASVVNNYLEKAVIMGTIQKITAENMKVCLLAHTFPKWSSRTIDSIAMSEIREVVDVDLKDKSESHRKNILKYIRAVFNFAVDDRLIASSPVPRITFKKEVKLQTVLNLEQTKIFLNKAKEVGSEWYPHWCTAIYTGMRNGELYALRWENVDFEKRQIWVVDSWTNKQGFKGTTKSSTHRIVEIAPELLLMLKELKLKSLDSVFVLPRIDKWDKGEQARELRIFLKYIGLPRIRFHDLRATWCTLMLSNGVEAIKVMKMGGWVEMQTMERYMRVAGVDIRGITDGLMIHDPLYVPTNNLVSLFGEAEN